MEQEGKQPVEDTPSGEEGFREQDRFLPIANVYKIMRRAVPQSAKISKEAKELVQECVSEFISFVTSECATRSPSRFDFRRLIVHFRHRASDRCIQGRRKTITGDDIIGAMEILGFDNYVVPLTIYMNKFREVCAIAIHAGRHLSFLTQLCLKS